MDAAELNSCVISVTQAGSCYQSRRGSAERHRQVQRGVVNVQAVGDGCRCSGSVSGPWPCWMIVAVFSAGRGRAWLERGRGLLLGRPKECRPASSRGDSAWAGGGMRGLEMGRGSAVKVTEKARWRVRLGRLSGSRTGSCSRDRYPGHCGERTAPTARQVGRWPMARSFPGGDNRSPCKPSDLTCIMAIVRFQAATQAPETADARSDMLLAVPGMDCLVCAASQNACLPALPSFATSLLRYFARAKCACSRSPIGLDLSASNSHRTSFQACSHAVIPRHLYY